MHALYIPEIDTIRLGFRWRRNGVRHRSQPERCGNFFVWEKWGPMPRMTMHSSDRNDGNCVRENHRGTNEGKFRIWLDGRPRETSDDTPTHTHTKAIADACTMHTIVFPASVVPSQFNFPHWFLPMEARPNERKGSHIEALQSFRCVRCTAPSSLCRLRHTLVFLVFYN